MWNCGRGKPFLVVFFFEYWFCSAISQEWINRVTKFNIYCFLGNFKLLNENVNNFSVSGVTVVRSNHGSMSSILDTQMFYYIYTCLISTNRASQHSKFELVCNIFDPQISHFQKKPFKWRLCGPLFRLVYLY